MNIMNFRILQLVQLLCAALLLVNGWLSSNLLICVLALLCAIFAIVGLISPTPEERVQAQIALLRQQGLYPQPGQATDEDVRRVLRAGHKLLAMRLYREIHNIPLRQAIDAVKRLD